MPPNIITQVGYYADQPAAQQILEGSFPLESIKDQCLHKLLQSENTGNYPRDLDRHCLPQGHT